MAGPITLTADQLAEEQRRDAVIVAAVEYVDSVMAFEKPKSSNRESLRLADAEKALRQSVIRLRYRWRKPR